jgi:4-hydroxy-3-polyprenylbenzoate decarboxylase
MNKKDISDIRGIIEFLKQEGELQTIKKPVDPIYEVAGIQVALDNGPAFLFENIKGYPGVRSVGNVFSRMDRIAKLFDVAEPKQLKFKCLGALKHPVPPTLVDKASCQEVIITKDIDINNTLPVLKATERDGARVMGSGMALFGEKYGRGGYEISFKRMHFRGKDWASLTASPGTHGEAILFKDHRDEDVPVTINICASPTVMMIAGAGLVHSIVPLGTDELAVAGGLEGSPIEICKAKTVDAYSIAKAEWVIEGIITTERVWETEEAEKLGKSNVAPFFPEWIGYLGRAWKSRKFQVTALTHRKEPIYYNWLADSYDGTLVGLPFREACFYEVADRLVPGLVIDVNIPFALRIAGGVIFQVKKRRPADEGFQRNIIAHALSAQPGIKLLIAVDDDVDIYNMDDVLWAIMTRANPTTDYILGTSGTRGIKAGDAPGGLAIDATVPFNARAQFERSHYPVDKIDLKKWLSEAEINAIKRQQSEYARCLARRAWQ